MSSPSRYRSNLSPIRNLQDKYSPSRNLDIILQEPNSSKLSARQSSRQYDQSSYRQRNNAPSQRYNSNYIDSRNILVQNDRLRNDNQILATSKDFTSQRYGKQLDLKDQQVQALRKELFLVEDRYEKENTTLRLENESLKRNLVLLQNQKFEQINILRQRYLTMPEQQTQQIRKSYANDITKALMDLQTTHILLNQKQRQFQHLSMICQQNSRQYGNNLQNLISQNNLLKNKLLQFQLSSEKQIRSVTAMKQLQKSRIQGIISYCKENTLYIEKQINRLADQLLKKNISIESFNREITKYQKLIQEQGKRNDDEVHRLKQEYEEIISDKDKTSEKMERQFKIDLAEKKRIQLELIERISSVQNQVDTLKKKLDFANQTIGDKDKVIRDLKDSINRKQDDHAKQISKVMSESKVRRKSAKNLSSYSSFKDIEQGQGSSIIKSGNLRRQQSILDDGTGGPLPTVRQEQNLARSQAMGHEEQQFQLRQLIIHYESLMQELKRNKMTQLSIANNRIESLKQSLNEKQQQILDILNRFSPLMEYKMNQDDIDEQRKRRIQEHQKGDIDLLSVMLQKYDIVALRRK